MIQGYILMMGNMPNHHQSTLYASDAVDVGSRLYAECGVGNGHAAGYTEPILVQHARFLACWGRVGLLCGRHIIIYSGTFILLYHNAASASLDGLLP